MTRKGEALKIVKDETKEKIKSAIPSTFNLVIRAVICGLANSSVIFLSILTILEGYSFHIPSSLVSYATS